MTRGKPGRGFESPTPFLSINLTPGVPLSFSRSKPLTPLKKRLEFDYKGSPSPFSFALHFLSLCYSSRN